jgi:hypothetical protein
MFTGMAGMRSGARRGQEQRMGKCFNTTGLCRPEMHYMVNIDGCLERMGIMVDNGVYFTVSRARQYGKTTALRLLKKRLFDNYVVLCLFWKGL